MYGSDNFHHFVLGTLDGFLSVALLLISVHTSGLLVCHTFIQDNFAVLDVTLVTASAQNVINL